MESEQDCKNEINLARNLFQDLIMKDEIFPGFILTNWKIWKMGVWEINQIKIWRNISFMAFVSSGSVIAVLPLNGGQGEVTLTQTPNPYLHLDPISRNISITKELDTDKDDNGNQMSNLILQVMCMPSETTRKVRYSYLKDEKYLRERWEIYTWKVRTIYMKSEKYIHETEGVLYLRNRSDFITGPEKQ